MVSHVLDNFVVVVFRFWIKAWNKLRDTDKNKNCFASIVCIWKYYFIYFSVYNVWKLSIVWKLVQKIYWCRPERIYLFRTFFDLELYFGKRFIRFFFFFCGLIYVERKWVGFVKHFTEEFPFLLLRSFSSSFYLYYFVLLFMEHNLPVILKITNHWLNMVCYNVDIDGFAFKTER